MKWHALDSEEVSRRLDSGEAGLDPAQAKQRLEKTGPNSLEVEEGVGPLRLLARQVNNPLIYLLIGAAVLSFVIGHRVDAGVIVGVVVLNTLLGFFQEWRAEGALNALRKMSAHHARVLRNGKPLELDASQVVPGDVLALETGDRVAADARILSSDNRHVDESALTGESHAVAKGPGNAAEDAPLADRRNMVWMSTNVTGGRGRAVVVETGMRTAMGMIAGDVRATVRENTPLQKRMHKLGLLLGVGGMALAVVVFGLGLLRGHAWMDMLMYAVAVAVSAIPEGLPAVISVTLALGVRRMALRNAIIRRMSAVETLGSTTVICSDKTGTITENQMTVRKLWAGGRTFEVSGDGYQPEGELRQEGGDAVGELNHARTVAFTAMAAFQWFQAFSARSTSQSVFSIRIFSNRPLLIGVGAAILLQLVVYTPVGQKFFGTTGLSGTDWILIVLVSSSTWVADEVLKRLGVYGKP